MSNHIYFEVQLLAVSVVTGICLMMLYDILRVFRMIVPHKNLMIGMEDFLYWMFASFVTFSLLYRFNDGRLRGYIILCVLLVMVLYDRMISYFFLKWLKKVGKYFKIRIKKKRWKHGK